jgi:outer membrane protein
MRRIVGTVPVVLLLACGVMVAPARSAAQDDSSEAELLTIDQAVKLALANNRDLKIVALNLDISKDKVEQAKTKRYPAFNVYAFGSQLLSPIAFVVPAGQFGTYPGIGPIPAHNTDISTPSQPNAYIFGTISQPLLTLYKINLHVHGEELSVQQSVQELREQRDTVVDNVREAYYSVVEIQNVIEAKKASIRQYEELDRITLEWVSEKVVLESDSLEVKAKLADERLQLLQAQDKLATAKETLNNLLGRDLNIDFQAQEDKELSPVEMDLKAAQATALAQNPKIKEAEIKIEQADTVKRLAKSEYMPDIGASFHYLSPFGINFVPTNIAAAGIEISWEPFDWGRRRDVVNEKTTQVEQSKLNLEQTKANVLVNLDKEFRSLQEARMAVDVAAAQQDATRLKLREVTDKYGQKTVLLREVLQQQAAVEKANADYNEAIASFWTAKANFEKALGAD